MRLRYYPEQRTGYHIFWDHWPEEERVTGRYTRKQRIQTWEEYYELRFYPAWGHAYARRY